MGISLFAALGIVYWIFASYSFEYNHFEGTVSVATTNNYSISKRVSLYYRALGTFILLFSGLLFLLGKWRHHLKELPEIKWLGGLSYFGIPLLLFQLMEVDSFPALKVLFCLALIPGIHLIIRLAAQKIPNTNQKLYLLAYSYGFSASYLIVTLLSLSGKARLIDFYTIWNLASILFFLLFYLNKQTYLWVFRLRKVVLIPLIYPLGSEIFLVAKQHEWSWLSYPAVALTLLLAVISLILRDCFKGQEDFKRAHFNIRNLLSKQFAPVALFVCSWSAYQLFQIPQHTEMFEYANQANGVMRMFAHGEVPFVDFFGSHLLHDLYQGILYTLLNGYDSALSFAAYDFLEALIPLAILYFLLLRLFGNWAFALLICLLLPFHQILFSSTYAVSLLLVFALFQLYQNPEKSWNYWKLVLLGLFIALWKMDFLVAGGGACLFTFIVIQKGRLSWPKILIPCIVILSGFILTLIIMAAIQGVSLGTNLAQVYHYFSGAQNHGWLDVSYHHDRYYYLHYFILPFSVVLMGLYHLYQHHRSGSLKKWPFISICLHFMIFFYLLNAQRGLVRHSFVEGSESYISAFIYPIITLFLYLYFPLRTKRFVRLVSVGFCLLGSLFLVGLKDLNNGWNEQSKLLTGIQQVKAIPSVKDKLQRTLWNDAFMAQEVRPFQEFFAQHLSPEASFIDFSNTPMLYYYTQRKVPSIFCQPLQNSHDEFLQAKQIIGFRKYQLPYLLYRHQEDGVFWDATDGVPNTLRYYLLSAYLHEEYKPFKLIGKHCVWIHKSHPKPKCELPEDSISHRPAQIAMGALPVLWREHLQMLCQKSGSLKNNKIQGLENELFITPSGNTHFLKLEGTEQGTKEEIQVEMISQADSTFLGSFSFWVQPGKNVYALPAFVHYLSYREPYLLRLTRPSGKTVSCQSGVFRYQKVIHEYE
ncbi:MAG: hypothetical protein EP338_03865 [Bacteroidetes bacterium]|nr:MAG: hypothetical protein EP338_03865 [Bacteroidota bacterium]